MGLSHMSAGLITMVHCRPRGKKFRRSHKNKSEFGLNTGVPHSKTPMIAGTYSACWEHGREIAEAASTIASYYVIVAIEVTMITIWPSTVNASCCP